MILPGTSAVARGIIIGLKDAAIQSQPCGIDLSLRKVFTWTTAGTVDFSNQYRAGSETTQLQLSGSPKSIHLDAGNYIVEFNEQVDIPLDVMGQIFVRSSLWRTGALLNAGVMDSGYKGAVGGMLQVNNPHGITLHENARLAQMVFHQMSEKVEGYSGMYQGAQEI